MVHFHGVVFEVPWIHVEVKVSDAACLHKRLEGAEVSQACDVDCQPCNGQQTTTWRWWRGEWGLGGDRRDPMPVLSPIFFSLFLMQFSIANQTLHGLASLVALCWRPNLEAIFDVRRMPGPHHLLAIKVFSPLSSLSGKLCFQLIKHTHNPNPKLGIRPLVIF